MPNASCAATMSLCRSNRPAEKYSHTTRVVLDTSSLTRSSSDTSPTRLASGTRDSSGPPGVVSMPLFSACTKLAMLYWYTRSSTHSESTMK